MSAASDVSGPLSASDIAGLQFTFAQSIIQFIYWGVHLSLAVLACHILWSRGLGGHAPARQLAFGLVLLMFAIYTASTVLFILNVFGSLLFLDGSPPREGLARRLYFENLAAIWLNCINYSLNDTIVVWRAWVLWSHDLRAKAALSVCLAITWLCTIIGSALGTVWKNAGALSGERAEAVRLTTYIPIILTNFVATSLIVYKAWLYRADVRTYLNGSLSSNGERIGQVFALLVECGGIYVVFWAVNLALVYKGKDPTNSFGVSAFILVWGGLTDGLSAIYPTLIILLVSNFMSQDAVIVSSHTRQDKSSKSSSGRGPKSDSGLGAANTELSTLRFTPHEQESSIASREVLSPEATDTAYNKHSI